MRRALILAAAVLAVAAPSAHAQLQGPITESLREQSCRTLLGGTVNAPDLLPGSSFPDTRLAAAWPAAAKGLLPDRVLMRSQTESFNARYAFAVRQGQIFFEPVAGGGLGWRQLPLPACFAGRVIEIAADDDELIALDSGRRVYTMDNASKSDALFDWSSRWGPPFWTGLGFTLPPDVVTWSWSVISPAEDKTWTDTAGNSHAAGTFKVSHIWALRPGGQRLTYWDPWLPNDGSYEACGPNRGRFRAVDLSTSGSTLFVIGRYGDMYTRFFDFDESGSDPVFLSYSYEPQKRGDPNAPIHLPAPDWVHQPKIRGRITSAISVSKVGEGAVHRTLRVEGLDRAGHTGYWEKDVVATASADWRFHRTDRPLAGRRLRNLRADASRRGQGAAADLRFDGRSGGYAISVPDFNVHCTPSRLRVAPDGGVPFELVLHVVDGLRQQPRAVGLDDVPREEYGNIEVPQALLSHLDAQPQPTRDFIAKTLGGRRFTTVTLEATRTSLQVKELGWTLRR